jgi:hypothetical protein
LPLLDDVPHWLRRGSLHLPIRRSRQNVNLFLRGPLPKRIVPIWVRDPIGFASPFITASTPAMNVELTAPMPGSTTPNFPCGASIFIPLEIIFNSSSKVQQVFQ